ncbi:hypothetical protein FOMPIDRAFT_1137302 [Fomitopsis schrenkii]|uniref:CxC1-like cysteine cluster associated with KDZ transposases domain-containing protein n=1 Tax=Fomitopsis schrenkii TaxID=2126942 RepID=S8EST8_FOMSC|nr:hypothetical protein FOMPIDRAFT_1137302 [Fomitopsis schrenkii]
MNHGHHYLSGKRVCSSARKEVNIRSGRGCSKAGNGTFSILHPLVPLIVLHASKRHDAHTQSNRTFVRTQEWRRQIPHLVDGFLAWKAGNPPCEADGLQSWDVLLVDFNEARAGEVIPASSDEYPNESLARHGYLGTAPTRPFVAIAFYTLEAYRQLHHVCPQLSIQAQVQALCRLHTVPYKRTLVNQFSITYDVYLEILHQVDLRVDKVLGRDTSNWKALNACSPCLYKLEGEPPLQYSMLVTMDGNQSLKLVDELFRVGKTLRDDRHGRSQLWLTMEEVDRWKDEAAEGASTPPASSAAAATDACEGGDYDEAFGFLGSPGKGDAQSQADVATCVERWQNAGPESRKKMFALFAITGVFVCLCWHGHLLAICDMVRSGELYVATISHSLAPLDSICFAG